MNHSSAHGYTDNELIAIWMGGYLIAKVYPNDRQIVKTSERGNWYSDDLKYDTSWDWLHPVIDKINTFDLSEFNYDVSRMTTMRMYQAKLQALSVVTPIGVVYELVVDICRWYYNQQSK